MAALRRGSLALLLPLAAIAVLSAPGSAYGERVLSANEQASAGGYDAYFTAVLGSTLLAQSFTPAEASVLRNVTLYVQNQGSQGDALNITIQGGDGEPDGTVLAAAERVRGGEGWLDFPFGSAPVLSRGSTYWIVAKSSEPALQGYRWHHSGGDTVAGRAKQRVGASAWSDLPEDFTYVAYGLPYEPALDLGFRVDRPIAAPGEIRAYTVYLNNSGYRAPPAAWVNLTLDAGLTFAADTAGAMGGVRTGLSWRFSDLGNGPASFRITAQVAPSAVGGQTLNATVHLDYADSTGAPQVPQTARASIVVALKTKPMHLWHDGAVNKADELRAAPPVGSLADFDGDGFPGMTLEATPSAWTLAPALARPLSLRGAVTADLFLNARNPGASAVLNLTLYDRRGVVTTLVASREVAVTLDANVADFERIAVSLGTADHRLAAGNATELRIQKAGGDDLWLAYGQSDVPSRVLVTTDTYISIDDVEAVDDRGGGGPFSARDNVNIRVNVSDPFGSGEIAGVDIAVSAPDGSTVASPLAPIATDPATPSAWKRFAHVLPQPQAQGEYAFVLTATERDGVESTWVGSFRVEYPRIGLVVTHDARTARPNGLVRFTLAFDNDGLGSGPVWINGTFPPELEYVQDTASAGGGAKTGPGNWSFPSVAPGPHSFEIVVRVAPGAANGTVAARFELAYGDAQGYTWFAGPEVRFVDLLVAPTPDPFDNPVVLALLGATAVGLPLGGYLLYRSRRPAIEEAFLIHRDGVLIYHLSRSLGGEGEKDRDILGAMLTAVQEFVKDSFKYGENRDLNTLEFGDYQVLIERGEHVFLAAVVAGRAGESEVRRSMRRAIEEMEEKYGALLAEWSGDMDRTLGVRDIVKRLLGRG